MGEVYFYHLTRGSVEGTLATLLPRALAQGWRVAVRGGDAERLAALDVALWTAGPTEGFLPHGLAGGGHDAAQPVLLTTGEAANGPDCVMCVDGAELTSAEVSANARSCILFDGLSGEALEAARAQWRKLTEAGCPARYWSEASGKWQEEATRNV